MTHMNKIKRGWFSEVCPMWPGMALSIEVKEVLYSERSKYQMIEVVETSGYGKMLILDGMIQLSESDEFAYHEMMVHLPMFSHPHPRRVLVIGGGDGGVVREIVRHDCVETVDVCEIDRAVIGVSKQFFPEIAQGYSDKRVNVHIDDGIEFVRRNKNSYDVIVIDSSDPIGPAVDLFKKPFYESLSEALKPGGVVAAQGESFFLHGDFVKDFMGIINEVFEISGYAFTVVPTYPGGHLGICLGSNGTQVSSPGRAVPKDMESVLKYYSSEIHEASFVLPLFAKRMLE